MTDQEEIVKGYDPVIMRKLLAYLKPYRKLVGGVIVALVISTIAELASPVVMQKAVDRYILPRYARISVDQAPAVPWLTPEDPAIGGYRYMKEGSVSEIPGTKRKELREKGVLSESEYYLFSVRGIVNQTAEIAARHPGIIEHSGEWGAMKRADLSALDPAERKTIQKGDMEGLTRSAVTYLVLLAGALCFSFFQVYLSAYIGQRVMRDMRNGLMEHTLYQSLGFMQKKPVGSLVSRITSDVETINEFFTSVSTALLRDLALMAGVFVALFFLDRRLALISLCTIPPVIVATVFFRFKARDAYRSVQTWTSRINAYLSEHLSGIGVVQAFKGEKRSESEFDVINTGLLKGRLGEMMVFATFRPIVSLFTSVSIGTVVYFGAGFHANGALTLGILFAFINLVNKFYEPVMELSEQFTILQSAMAGGERVFDLLAREERVPDTGTFVPGGGSISGAAASTGLTAGGAAAAGSGGADGFRGNITFRNVRFSYVPDEPVLNGISFDVGHGETVAIVGYTGAGKTTIASLLTRFWDGYDGDILLSGRNIREYPLSVLRKLVVPVQQDVFLFSGTVEENISLGSGFTRERVIEAARTVHADEFIRGLPQGYETPVQEGGSNLSTGQRQLISFARVIAHDPEVVILDEATGSVDTETEKLIQMGLQNLLADRTSIVIAHRLSTVRNASRILVLSAGRVIETGTHEELLARDGLYRNLYELQFENGAARE